MLTEQTLNQLRALRLDSMVAALNDAATHIAASELPFEQRLLEELHVAHGDGSFSKRLAQLARLDLLILEDFGIAPIAAHERNDLLELLDDRVGTRSTLITSQLQVTAWHAWLDEPTLADAILDRIVHGSHKIALKGESMRKLSKTT